MKRFFAPLDRIAAMYFGDLNHRGVLLARFAIIFTVFVAVMSFGFGKEMHWVHGFALAALSITTAIIPDMAHDMFEKRKPIVLGMIALFGAPLFVMEFATHAGYAAGFRGKDIEEARVQNTRFDGAYDGVKEAKTNLEIFTAQLKTLMEQNAWAATVKAEALREQAENLEKSIASETKLGGCGRKCRGLQDDLTKVKNQIAVAEQRADIEKQIEATKRVIDKNRAKADSTEHKSSVVGHQSGFFAKTAALATGNGLKVNDVIAEGAEHGLAIGLAYAFTIGPAMAWFFAGLNRVRRKQEDDIASPSLPPAYRMPRAVTPMASGPNKLIMTSRA